MYFIAVWYIYFVVNLVYFPVLVCYTKKNLATLVSTRMDNALPDIFMYICIALCSLRRPFLREQVDPISLLFNSDPLLSISQ
jgi:hypothetical protein